MNEKGFCCFSNVSWPGNLPQAKDLKAPFWFDVTLRDGNQALKTPWNTGEKLAVFELLMNLGVGGIEVGYPGASQQDFDAFVQIARLAPEGVVITALARAEKKDIDRAIEALSYVEKATPRLHTFIGMSPFHMDHVLQKPPLVVFETALQNVVYARRHLGAQAQIQFSPEHFGDCLANLDWVKEKLGLIAQNGADVINLPNTVERYRPAVFAEMVRQVALAMPSATTLAVHCHNDLGMGTATTVESYFAGARQLEVTLNGLGERAGNSNLSEVAVALQNNGVDVGLNLEAIYGAALKIAKYSGVPIHKKAPLVGAEVFVHRSGIHQNGSDKTQDLIKGAYRPIDPKLIGRAGDEELRFTSQSGHSAVRAIIMEQGEDISDEDARLLQPALKAVSGKRGELDPEELLLVYQEYLGLKEKKQHVDAQDLVALAENTIHIRGKQTWKLVSVVAISSELPTAGLCLERDGRKYRDSAIGDGPVDAVFEAMKKITGIEARLKDYQVGNVSLDADSQAQVLVKVEYNSRDFVGTSADPDTIRASARACLDVTNRILRGEKNGNSH